MILKAPIRQRLKFARIYRDADGQHWWQEVNSQGTWLSDPVGPFSSFYAASFSARRGTLFVVVDRDSKI